MSIEIPLPDKVTVEDIRNMIAGIRTRDTQKRVSVNVMLGGRGLVLVVEENLIPPPPLKEKSKN